MQRENYQLSKQLMLFEGQRSAEEVAMSLRMMNIQLFSALFR